MKNHNEISEFIWSIKEHIRDDYAEKDYEEVILPFTLLRRIDCVLDGTNEKVVEVYEKFKNTAEPEVLDRLLKKASRHNFYNRSHYSLLKITKDPNIGANFDAYLKDLVKIFRIFCLILAVVKRSGPESGRNSNFRLCETVGD